MIGYKIAKYQTTELAKAKFVILFIIALCCFYAILCGKKITAILFQNRGGPTAAFFYFFQAKA